MRKVAVVLVTGVASIGVAAAVGAFTLAIMEMVDSEPSFPISR